MSELKNVQDVGMGGSHSGVDLLNTPQCNKGLEFSEETRNAKRLRGLLPPVVLTKEQQLALVLDQLRRKPNDMEKYHFTQSLQDINEELFFRLLIQNVEELMPIVYTPTVGQACLEFSRNYRQTPRGLYISLKDIGKIHEILKNWPEKEVKAIVFTDGERILGLGDLGMNGMGIPIGKLALYTACAGVHPRHCLPIVLDVGTDNVKNLEDPFYLGLKQKRERGQQYYEFIDEFMTAAKSVYGDNVLLQFEDFGNSTAFQLLRKYQMTHCTFNDDIQGTAAVVLAGLLVATRVTKKPITEQKFLFLGAGEAGTGIADLICLALQKHSGDSLEEVRKKVFLVDSKGLVVASRKEHLQHHKLLYAHDVPECSTLLEAVKTLKPTTLIGVCTIPNSFTKEICEEMSRLNEIPIIFALSNPTSKAECTPHDAYEWTNGKCIYASGSPFQPVTFNGKKYLPGQGNNAYIFPGLGLGVLSSGMVRITDEIMLLAAETLAKQVEEEDLQVGRVYPSFSKIRQVSLEIAIAVAEQGYATGTATMPKPQDLRKHCASLMYSP